MYDRDRAEEAGAGESGLSESADAEGSAAIAGVPPGPRTTSFGFRPFTSLHTLVGCSEDVKDLSACQVYGDVKWLHILN